MLINKLPKTYRRLVQIRIKQGHDDFAKALDKMPEGYAFWSDVYNARSEKELP